MAKFTGLTARQEGFAYCVGYKRMNYSDAYRENYSVSKMKNTTINCKASIVCSIEKVSERIDYWRSVKVKEEKRSFTWSLSETEKELRDIIKKNKNDLLRAEKNGEAPRQTTNDSLIRAISLLDDINKRLDEESSELSLRKLKAETELVETKNKLMKDQAVLNDEQTVYEINL